MAAEVNMKAQQISRRQFVLGAASLLTLPSFSLPAMAHYNPRKLKSAKLTTDLGRKVTATFADLDATPAPAVLIIHGKWGLTGGVRWVASELGRQGYLAIAPDLFKGQLFDDPKSAEARMIGLETELVMDTLTSWTKWLKAHFLCTGKVAVLGWGHGASWALRTASKEPIEAVISYDPEGWMPKESLPPLTGKALYHHSDGVNQEAYKSLLQTGTEIEKHSYNTQPGFTNAFRENYDAKADKQSWNRTLDFLKNNL